MKSTKLLLNAVRSAGDKAILKPPSQWDTLTSAFASTMAILSSQTDRDQFVQTVNKGIINPSILGQADMGFFKTLALHHDLNSDLFKRHKFNAEEFLETAEPALQRFQEILYCWDKDALPGFIDEIAKVAEKDEGKIPGSLTDAHELNKSMEKMQQIEESIMGKGDWQKKAEENPKSLYAQLHAMVSDQLMDSFETQFKQSVLHCYINHLPRMNYTPESSEIENIALVSARVHEIIQDDGEEEPDTEDAINLDDSFSSGIEINNPTAAQIEVIYSISQSFIQEKIHDEGADTEAKAEVKNLETAWVAVFEGMLSDGTDGSEKLLRWKLVDNRPAWEFPGLNLSR